MEKINKEVENAIIEAIKLEINGRKFFNHAADITEHEKGKKMFRFLADEEVKHLETFGNMFNKILGGTDWKQYIPKDVQEEEAPLVTRLKESMRREEGKGEVEAIRIGI